MFGDTALSQTVQFMFRINHQLLPLVQSLVGQASPSNLSCSPLVSMQIRARDLAVGGYSPDPDSDYGSIKTVEALDAFVEGALDKSFLRLVGLATTARGCPELKAGEMSPGKLRVLLASDNPGALLRAASVLEAHGVVRGKIITSDSVTRGGFRASAAASSLAVVDMFAAAAADGLLISPHSTYGGVIAAVRRHPRSSVFTIDNNRTVIPYPTHDMTCMHVVGAWNRDEFRSTVVDSDSCLDGFGRMVFGTLFAAETHPTLFC